MCFTTMVCLTGMIVGLIAVASNPSPYFGALGLVVVAGMGCGGLAQYGSPFLALVLFLIYLGGMLVVFAYSAALAAEPFPETWGDRSVMVHMMIYTVSFLFVASTLGWGWSNDSTGSGDEWEAFDVFRADTGGVAVMYSEGGWMLVIGAGVLLLTLFVVLELTRGLNRGALRAV
uniref:NADH-ubiquinone oxidoreductase chain 6 n=1 Tax=Cephalopholis miniata TaxID=334914 RepID=A0A8B0JSB9_CEPMI|nr:NADH dehydrogenase subunit 6 [Cephalopholis miniata]YP_010463381.1 NADH dehydrogenase subunit 6 [Cephalopholis spiloparaea]QTV20426.1 NADH dehydrogenase subunit 6 [Cephalopholis miniata]UUK29357.1 NADH dehydrogenase subunit 6 [Cephalopholis spiloparaea]